MVNPTDDCIAVSSQLLDSKLSGPPVVHQWLHGRLRPILLAIEPKLQRCGHRVVAVGKHIGLDSDRVADDALDGKFAAVDLRVNVLDDDSGSSVDVSTSHLVHEKI
jgi:hypothetical protein